MKIRQAAIAALFLLLSVVAPTHLRAAEKVLTEKEKIEALIANIEALKDATFIRNGSDYDAKAAGTFLRGKWRAQEKEIKTAVEFIDKLASVSSTSGKAYIIRFKGSREVKCGDYLKEELKQLEKPKEPPPLKTP